jgi:hypothetical protein
MRFASNPARWQDRTTGLVLVLAVAFAQILWLGTAVVPLSAGLLVAYLAWAVAPWKSEPEKVLPMYLIAIAVQCAHVAEEFAAGFQRQFPPLLGSRWDDTHFVTFNLAWLAAFVFAALGVYRRKPLAYLAVLFLGAVGGVANGAGHLLLCAVQHRYFPGAITAPICLLVGILVLETLFGGSHSRKQD